MLTIKMPINHITVFIKKEDDSSAVRTAYLIGKFTSPEIKEKMNATFNQHEENVKKVMVMDVVKDSITVEVTDATTDIETLAYNAIHPLEDEPIAF